MTCTAGHPTVVAWAQSEVTDDNLVEAVERARLHKPPPAPIPIAYLARIVDDVLTAPRATPPPQRQSEAWWSSEQATLKKGQSINLHPRGGESWEEFRARIRARLKEQEARV